MKTLEEREFIGKLFNHSQYVSWVEKRGVSWTVATFFALFDEELRKVLSVTLTAPQWVEAEKEARKLGINNGEEFLARVIDAHTKIHEELSAQEIFTRGGYPCLVVNNG